MSDYYFGGRVNPSRVTFSESSSLKVIGKKAFRGFGVHEIHTPEAILRDAITGRRYVIKLA